MEEAAELGNYLPLSLKSLKEQEYIAFLWETYRGQVSILDVRPFSRDESNVPALDKISSREALV
jgi:hypothetical protein